MQKLAALVGPTAVGKTEVSVLVAEKLGAEIISCDSMQVYRGMDIGTAKADFATRQRVTHHLVDVVEPEVNFTVADYQKLAQGAINEIAKRGKLPLLVGGTGLYYQAVVDKYDFFPVEARQEVRQRWERALQEQGLTRLYELLQAIDPEYAAKIGSNDRKRTIRALEVYDLTGQPFSRVQQRNREAYQLAAVGLCRDRDQLYARIEARIDQMIAEGLVDEVVKLRVRGYSLDSNAMQALGYKQVYCYLEGMINWEDCLRDIKQETRNFAKRQLTWFKRDKRITWINVTQYIHAPELADKICEIVEGQFRSM
ncbi:MAG: tRNA (adenosine(37)-N6)-dimethylallyltransferase MiaA [Syntrophomonadaceae bacterium]|nr:tRNA (adenosine(37)-N6)-dimethylallyltransferase MiaA [Syntrophomonadaceae bacterium]